MNTIRRLAGPLALIVVVAACSAGGPAAPSVTPGPSAPAASPSPDPSAPATGAPGGGTDPGVGGGLIVPKPGQIDPKPVPMDGLTATVDGRHVVITAAWTSGVEPCYVLDTVLVDKDGLDYTITLREGHGPDDVACIEIAQLKATQIDLGDLEPGTYTFSDGAGGAAPIKVVVG